MTHAIRWFGYTFLVLGACVFLASYIGTYMRGGVYAIFERWFNPFSDVMLGIFCLAPGMLLLSWARGREEKTQTDAAINPIEAINLGNLAEFRRFVQANPRALDTLHEPNHWTLLHHLASLGSKTLPVHSTMALELIEAGADVNCRTPLGWTPLIMIATGGEKEAVSLTKILIDHGADVGAVDKHGCDWQIYWQHGEEIRAVLDVAMTPAQKEANRRHLEQLYSPGPGEDAMAAFAKSWRRESQR
jgi:hypothetical protein